MERDACSGAARFSPRLSAFCLSLCVLCLAGEIRFADAGSLVRIGATASAESALLAEIAAELVRQGFDTPQVVPGLANHHAAWQALREGALDVYPVSINTLAEKILHRPDWHDVDQLRQALIPFSVRLTDPVGGSGWGLLYRADLPNRAPTSALVLLKMPPLVAPEEMRLLIASGRRDGISARELAANFLHAKSRPAPSPASHHPLGTAVFLIMAALGVWAVQQKIRKTKNAVPSRHPVPPQRPFTPLALPFVLAVRASSGDAARNTAPGRGGRSAPGRR